MIALGMIEKHCGSLKWKKKIVLVTDGTGLIAGEELQADLQAIRDKINQDSIDLVVL